MSTITGTCLGRSPKRHLTYLPVITLSSSKHRNNRSNSGRLTEVQQLQLLALIHIMRIVVLPCTAINSVTEGISMVPITMAECSSIFITAVEVALLAAVMEEELGW